MIASVPGALKTDPVETVHFGPDEQDAAVAFSREHANSHPGSSPTTVFAGDDGEERSEAHGLIEGIDYRTVFSGTSRA